VRLPYFPAAKHQLLRRLSIRNTEQHANALFVNAEALDDFRAGDHDQVRACASNSA
jgi:hypothetical protein